jgi:hypothetical protein
MVKLLPDESRFHVCCYIDEILPRLRLGPKDNEEQVIDN